MKRIKNLGILLFILTLSSFQLTAQDCDPSACTDLSMKQMEVETKVASSMMEKDDKAISADITFKANKLIEVALLSVKAGKESQFMNDYFSQVMPVAMPYGARPIASFAVTRKVEGTKPAQMVVFFEWESIDQKRSFEKNPKYLELRNLRDDALSFLSQGYFQVQEDVNYTISDDKVYDFAGLFIDPNNAPKLEEYFGAVFPVAQSPKYGYTPIATLASIPGVHDQNYHPTLIAFAEWKGGSKAVDMLQKTPEFKNNVAKRTAAAPYMDVFHLKPILQ